MNNSNDSEDSYRLADNSETPILCFSSIPKKSAVLILSTADTNLYWFEVKESVENKLSRCPLTRTLDMKYVLIDSLPESIKKQLFNEENELITELTELQDRLKSCEIPWMPLPLKKEENTRGNRDIRPSFSSNDVAHSLFQQVPSRHHDIDSLSVDREQFLSYGINTIFTFLDEGILSTLKEILFDTEFSNRMVAITVGFYYLLSSPAVFLVLIFLLSPSLLENISKLLFSLPFLAFSAQAREMAKVSSLNIFNDFFSIYTFFIKNISILLYTLAHFILFPINLLFNPLSYENSIIHRYVREKNKLELQGIFALSRSDFNSDSFCGESQIKNIISNYENTFRKRHPRFVGIISLGVFSTHQSQSSAFLVEKLKNSEISLRDKKEAIKEFFLEERNGGKALWKSILTELGREAAPAAPPVIN